MSRFVDFVRNNFLLFMVALVSGGMLLWPLVRRTTGGPWVSTTQATHLINREDALVIDVREPNEFAAGHVIGAKNLPLARLDAPGADLAKKKERPVIVYCDMSRPWPNTYQNMNTPKLCPPKPELLSVCPKTYPSDLW